MDLSKILSITGKSGLYKFLSKTTNSFIVEGLDDGKRFPAFSNDGVAALDNIAIFTDTEEVPLQTVFQNIYRKEDGKKMAMLSKAATPSLECQRHIVDLDSKS